MHNLNKIKINLIKYQNKKEVEAFLVKNFEKTLDFSKCEGVFTKEFLNENALIDFGLTIDGVEVFSFFNPTEIEEIDHLVPNKDLLDYVVLLGNDEVFNFYNCSCGYPECGGFYGVPYVIFNNNSKTLIQMLLKKENGYGELIQKLKDNGIVCNQNFEFEKIIYSSNDGYSQIKECFQNLTENELILTFDYNDFLPFKNKLFDWVKQGKGVLTADLLVKNYVLLYAETSKFKLNKFERSKLIKNNLSKLAKRTSRLIKTFSFKERVFKKIRKEVYLFLNKHNLKHGLVWQRLKESFVYFSIENSIVDSSSFQYNSSIMNLLENYIFDKVQINLNIKYKGLKEAKRNILNNWIEIQKEINILLTNFVEVELLLEEDRNSKEFLTKEELFDKQKLQKWLDEFNYKIIPHKEKYDLENEMFKHINRFIQDYRQEYGYVRKCSVSTYEELIHIFENIFSVNSKLFSMLNQNVSVVRGNSLVKKYRIIHKQ